MKPQTKSLRDPDAAFCFSRVLSGAQAFIALNRAWSRCSTPGKSPHKPECIEKLSTDAGDKW